MNLRFVCLSWHLLQAVSSIGKKNSVLIPACFSVRLNITYMYFKSCITRDVISASVCRSMRPDCYLLLPMRAGFCVIITFRFCKPVLSVEKNPQKCDMCMETANKNNWGTCSEAEYVISCISRKITAVWRHQLFPVLLSARRGSPIIDFVALELPFPQRTYPPPCWRPPVDLHVHIQMLILYHLPCASKGGCKQRLLVHVR